MDDYAVGRFKAFYNLIIYGYDTMNSPQVVNSSCRNNQEQEEGYNAGIAEIALNRECIKAYIERRTTERYLDAHTKACMNYTYDLERTIERKEKDCTNEDEKTGYTDATLDLTRYKK